jgi:8-oxo-dGTP diphosphatase
MAEDKLFCVGQKAFIARNGEVLVLNDPKANLDFPGGKIQEGEADFTESLKREVRDETGLEIEVGDPFVTWYYEFKPGHRNFGKTVYLVGFRCRYVSGEVGLSDEHDTFRWVSKEDFRTMDDGSVYFGALEKYFANG